jgi:hypothetical protein
MSAIKNNEMGSVYNMHMGDDKYSQNYIRMGDWVVNVREVQ